jgi:hypothetical protein
LFLQEKGPVVKDELAISRNWVAGQWFLLALQEVDRQRPGVGYGSLSTPSQKSFEYLGHCCQAIIALRTYRTGHLMLHG